MGPRDTGGFSLLFHPLKKKVSLNITNLGELQMILTKFRLVKAMVFPVVMYGCDSWTVKKAEHRRIDAFELWCLLEKTLESPLDCKEFQPVHLKGDQS